METIKPKSELNFFKWENVGDSITFVVDELPVWDKPNPFGQTDNFIVGTDDEGQRHSIPLPHQAKAAVKEVEESIVVGQTRFCIRYVARKSLPASGNKKARQLKMMEVAVEGLKE